MNTSNKILLVFFLLVFLVPVLVMFSFRSKVKNGEFTVVNSGFGPGRDSRSGNFMPYKVIKLVAPEGGALKCNLQYSDSLYYSYSVNQLRDSIRVYNLADTLFIQYIRNIAAGDNTSLHERSEIYINVKLPSITQLVVNNAEAIIQSGINRHDSMLVELHGSSQLSVGTHLGDNNDKNQSHPAMTIEQLSIDARGGELRVGDNVTIQQLTLNARGNSVVSIKEGAVIGDVQGNLSDSSTVNASWKYVRKLAALTNN